jgi:hypothetical protein
MRLRAGVFATYIHDLFLTNRALGFTMETYPSGRRYRPVALLGIDSVAVAC